MDQDLLRELEKYASDMSLPDKFSTVSLDPNQLGKLSELFYKKMQDKESDMMLGSDKFIVEEVDCPEVFRESVIGREWLKGNTFLVVERESEIYRVPRGTAREQLHRVSLTSLHSEKGTREAAWLRDQAKRAGLGINTKYVFITVRVEQPKPQVKNLPFEDIQL